MPKTAVHKVRKFALSADAIWQVLGRFDNGWHPDVAKCALIRAGDGALVRSFEDSEGNSYQERRTYLSDTDRVVCYQLEQGIVGAQSYTARVEVSPDGSGSLVTWHADIVASAERLEEIARGTGAIFEAGFDALENAPKPKPVKRSKLGPQKSEISSQRLDGVPCLEFLTNSPDANAADDTLVLFLHGIGGNASNWAGQLKVLGAHYRVAALNLRGYGGSSLGFEPTKIEDYCDDILRVMEAHGATRLVLAGLSLGSWIATSFAMRHCDVLAGLVLSGGCTGMSEADPRERESFRVSREVPLDAGQTPADFAPAVVDIIAGPDATTAQREDMEQSMSSISADTYRDALNCFCNPLERFDFSKIDCPVLLFTGEHDRLAPPPEIRRISERIAEAQALSGKSSDIQFEIIPGAGHICNLEAVEATNALLHRFLSRLPGVAKNYKSSLRERQLEKRERIRRAAHDEFCENGFDGASMDRIAERAEVSKPTLYQYFGGKEGLLEAVLDAGRHQIVAPLMVQDGALAQRLWRFAWTYAEFVLRPDMLSLARLILGEATRRPENAIAYHRNGPERAFEGLVEFILEATKLGELETDAPDLAAQDLWSLILSGPRDHYLHYVDQRPTEQELLRSISNGLRVFLKAYGSDPQSQINDLEKLVAAKEADLSAHRTRECQP